MGIFQTIVYYLSTMKDLLLTFLLIGAVAYASSESFQDETIAYEAASPVTFEEAADTVEDTTDSVSALVDQVPDTTLSAVPVGKEVTPKRTTGTTHQGAVKSPKVNKRTPGAPQDATKVMKKLPPSRSFDHKKKKKGFKKMKQKKAKLVQTQTKTSAGYRRRRRWRRRRYDYRRRRTRRRRYDYRRRRTRRRRYVVIRRRRTRRRRYV